MAKQTDRVVDPELERERVRLIAESAERSSGPHRVTNEEIARSRARFDGARELLKTGQTEAARRLFWWPRNEDPPKEHWSRVPHNPCSCRRKSPDGPLGLCGYCAGTTDATPSIIPVREIRRA